MLTGAGKNSCAIFSKLQLPFLCACFSTCNSGMWDCKGIEQSTSCAAGLVYQKHFNECGSTCDSYGLCYSNKPNCGGCACPDGKVFNKEVSASFICENWKILRCGLEFNGFISHLG